MCVVDGEGAHPNKARNLPRLLVKVDRAQLGNPHRELAEAVSLSLEHSYVVRTIHGPQLPLLLLHLRGRVHGIAIALEMTADLVNVEPGDVRRLDVLVALPPLEAEDELLHLAPDGGAFGRQQRQPAANHLVDQEEVELFAELPVVPLGRVLQHFQVGVELFLGGKRGAVDAGQLLVLLASLPIGARDGEETERTE